MTSNGKQFIVTREMLTAVARDQRWPDVVAEISASFQNVLLFCFATSSRETLREILGKQNSLFPSGPVIKARFRRRTSHEPNRIQ